MPSDNDKDPTTGKTPATDDPTNPAASKTPPADNPKDAKSDETPDDFDKDRAMELIKKLRATEREHNALLKKIETDEEAKLAEQNQFKELAEKRKAELDEAQKKADEADRYRSSLETYLKAEREGIPEHILPLLDKMDVVDQLDYIAENRETLKGETKRDGVPATPKDKSKAPEKGEAAKQYVSNRYRSLRKSKSSD